MSDEIENKTADIPKYPGIELDLRLDHSEDTLFKVNAALRRVGIDEDRCREAILEMQNDGILFREMMG